MPRCTLPRSDGAQRVVQHAELQERRHRGVPSPDPPKTPRHRRSQGRLPTRGEEEVGGGEAPVEWATSPAWRPAGSLAGVLPSFAGTGQWQLPWFSNCHAFIPCPTGCSLWPSHASALPAALLLRLQILEYNGIRFSLKPHGILNITGENEGIVQARGRSPAGTGRDAPSLPAAHRLPGLAGAGQRA